MKTLRKLNLNSTHLSPLTFEALKVRQRFLSECVRMILSVLFRKNFQRFKNAIFGIQMLGEYPIRIEESPKCSPFQ